jgi:RNA polymerase sigma factor (sigma-70 family)
MATPQKAIQQLRQLARAVRSDGLTDADLLQQFMYQRDELAFETLVHRHGPLVLGVCRRLLRNRHDAEDAFQATFLVLARQAGSIRKPAALAGWLHGVAQRTALALRKAAARRRVKEAQAMPRTEMSAADATELCEVLDQELAGLPEKYRVAILLCDLEGKLQRQAAQELGCAEGTLASRLVRGRRLLAARLTQRGLTLSGAALASWLAQESAGAGVPASLVAAVTALGVGRSVASISVTTLTQGVLKMMLVTKLRAVTALLLVLGALTAATGAFVLAQDHAGQDPRKGATPKLRKLALDDTGLSDAEFIRKVCLELRGSLPTDIEVHYFLQDRNQQKRSWLRDMLQQEAARARKQDGTPTREGAELRDVPHLVEGLVVKKQTDEDLERLQGEWEVVELKMKNHIANLPKLRLIFKGHRLTVRGPTAEGKDSAFMLQIDKTDKIRRLKFVDSANGEAVPWAYEWKGDRLRMATRVAPTNGKAQPLSADVFETPPADDVQFLELQRVRVGEPPLTNLGRGGGHIVTSALRVLKIPIRVEESRQASIAVVKVFIFSEIQREVWQIQLLPSAKDFTFVAPHDGLYRFTLQTQGIDGRVEPADVRAAGPDLVVNVSTDES